MNEPTPVAEPRFLIIGQIAKPHGVRGEVAVTTHTDVPERFSWLKFVYISRDAEDVAPSKVKVNHVRFHQERPLIKLAGYNSREEADELRLYWLFVPESEAIPLAEHEHFWHDLVGLAVYTDDDTLLGEVSDILHTGANDVFVVRASSGKDILLPDIDEVVLSIDVAQKRMRVHLLPGLLG